MISLYHVASGDENVAQFSVLIIRGINRAFYGVGVTSDSYIIHICAFMIHISIVTCSYWSRYLTLSPH
jgi:hypothetical protein